MTSGFSSAGVDFDNIFDPYMEGTKPANTGYTISGYGDLANRYAPIIYGTKAPNVGYSKSGVGDLSNLWAAKGTASYNLPINGKSYSSYASAGGASLTLTMSNNGTYQVTNNIGTVLDSGYWLPSGGLVSDYTCYFTTTMLSGPDPGGGTDYYNNSAPTQQPLTTTQSFQGGCLASVGAGQSAYNAGNVVLYLYRSGTLRSTTTIHFETAVS